MCSVCAASMLNDSGQCHRDMNEADLGNAFQTAPENISRSQVVTLLVGTKLFARFNVYVNLTVTDNVNLTIPAGAIMDSAGNLNEEENISALIDQTDEGRCEHRVAAS